MIRLIINALSRKARVYISSLAVVFAISMTSSCDLPSQHLFFKGIPMNGSISNFEKKLIKKGYERGPGGVSVNELDIWDEISIAGQWDPSETLGAETEFNLYGTDVSSKIYEILGSYVHPIHKDGKISNAYIDNLGIFVDEFIDMVHLYEQKYGDAKYRFYPKDAEYDSYSYLSNAPYDGIDDGIFKSGQDISLERLKETVRFRDGLFIAAFNLSKGSIRIMLEVEQSSWNEKEYEALIGFLYRDKKNSKLIQKERDKYERLINKRHLDNI